MDPTPTPAPAPVSAAPPASAEPLVDLFRTQRQNTGFAIAVLSVLFLAGTIFLFWQGYHVPKSTEKKTTIGKQLDEENPESKPDEEIVNPKRTDYMLGAVLSLFACLAMGAMALWLMGGLPYPDEAQQRTIARIQILATGGLLGLLLVLAGGGYFYLWVDSLGNYFDKGQEKELTWVVVPLLMVLVGAALVMLGVQPARAEERNNTLLRRLVYGANLALTSMLLLVVLIAANVLISYRVTSKFDTTAGGFYSMSKQTEDFLGSLDQTILAYAVLPAVTDRRVSDLRDVLIRFQEASHDKFKVIFISSSLNTVELTELKQDYPPLQEGEMGVILTFASDKKRFSFIPIMDFFSQERASETGGEPRSVFVGEGRLVKELLFLADNKQKPRIYFTQSSGELQLSAGEGNPMRSISSLQTYLEKNYLEIRPLAFDLDNPKVPEDCAILVVADPEKTLPPKQVEAIRKYMQEPLSGGKKGKLVVFSGAPVKLGGGNPKLTPTGLEPLLNGFNVNLIDKFLFALSADRRVPPFQVPVSFTADAVRTKNSIATLLSSNSYMMVFPKEVEARSTPGSPQFTATPLLATDTEQGAWLDTSYPDNFGKSALEGQRVRNRPVAVVVSEAGMGRLAVFGNGFFLNDLITREMRGENGAFDLVGATIDWLRDRPPVPSGVESKTYAVYRLGNAKTVDKMRLEYLPLGLGLLAVAGIGLGIWLTRRQMA